jgi:diguanylate cyclase (GGDEF)-like protein
MAMAEAASRPAGSFPWAGLFVALSAGGISAAGLFGELARWGQHLQLGRPGPSLLLAVMGLGPLVLYAWALERGKPAPAWRQPLAPWVLFAPLHLCVQLGGGAQSPLLAAYVLLLFFLGRHAAGLHAVGILLVVSAQLGLPLAQAGRDGDEFWPGALVLLPPWLALAFGWLGRPELRSPAPRRLPAPAAAESAGLPLEAPAEYELPQRLEAQLRGAMEILHHAYPALGSLTLWWGDATRVRLRQGLSRGCALVSEAVVEPGESLLGLALRERRVLSVEPLSANAASELPYYTRPQAVRCLRVVPLNDEGRLVGLLACDKQGEESFSPSEAAALEALGRQLVRHAQEAAYLQRLRLQAGRTERLYEATKALAADLDRAALLQRFGELLLTLVPCDSWLLALRESDGKESMRRLASHAYLSELPAPLPVERSALLMATLEGSEGALLFNRTEGAQVPAALTEGLLGEAQHFLLAPLRLGGRLRGVLKLDRRQEPFSEEERDIAFIFASQAAVTLENARLYTLHQRQATTDGLTGLYNHRYFQERLALELEKARRAGQSLSLALTDIDFFKKFNDTFGHQQGDIVLKQVAEMLCAKVRSGRDIVCRYGGEEFVVIMPDCDVVEARQVMDALRAHSAAHLIGGTGPEARPITLSIGLCTYPQGASEQRELIHRADEALYKAKRDGRNRVCSWHDL